MNVTVDCPQITEVNLPAPHGDCAEVDEEMDKILNYYYDRFSYSQKRCTDRVYRVLNILDQTSHFPQEMTKYNPNNITTLFGKPIKDFKWTNNEEHWDLRESLPLKCPRKCTVQSYDIKHVVMDRTNGYSNKNYSQIPFFFQLHIFEEQFL